MTNLVEKEVVGAVGIERSRLLDVQSLDAVEDVGAQTPAPRPGHGVGRVVHDVLVVVDGGGVVVGVVGVRHLGRVVGGQEAVQTWEIKWLFKEKNEIGAGS